MRKHAYAVKATWDDEAKVWVAESEDVPGLATEAHTLEALIAKLRVIIPELLEANGELPKRARGGRDLPIELLAQYHERIRLAS
ncbi:MAG: DUF1902 domain-containing protein [Candidatus Binataceae bacterium]